MNKISQSLLLIIALFAGRNLFAQTNAPAALLKEVEEAEAAMFAGMNGFHPEYQKQFISDDFVAINADGIMVNKEQVFADSARSKLFGLATYKYFDKKIRVYGDVGIVNGRGQAFMSDKMVVEFLYTAVFVKQNGKWMYASWQGTISKDSPPPPPMPKN